MVLVLVNLFSGAALAHYEATIAAVVVLVSFLPLLIGSGGNAGAQTATLIIRAMATGDVQPSEAKRLLLREVAVSLCIGLLMAAAVFFLGWIRGGPMVGAVVATAMLAVVVFGSLVGLMLPLGLHRFGFDPAAAGTPLITSVADIGGILIYFSIAQAWLGGGGVS
jgi:magnesium transporter